MDALDTVSFFEENPIPMWIIREPDLHIVSANNAAVKIYGYTMEEFAKMCIIELYPSSDKEIFKYIHDTGELDGSDRRIWRHLKADGGILNVDFRYQAIHKKNDEQMCIMMALPVDRKADMYEIKKYRHMGMYGFLKKESASESELNWMEKIYDLVLGQLDKSFSIEDLASQMSQSTRTLNRNCKDLTGLTPSQLVQQIKFGRVRFCYEAGLVRKTEEMAKMIGYSDSYYFIQKYKDIFGTSLLK